MHKRTFKISPKGVITTIYSDDLAPLLAKGKVAIRRASHVEPSATGSGWTADLAPVGGPVLGPFPLRQEALDAEVRWLDTWLH
jgi:hypothetical protein